jgi:hypothetical protein
MSVKIFQSAAIDMIALQGLQRVQKQVGNPCKRRLPSKIRKEKECFRIFRIAIRGMHSFG